MEIRGIVFAGTGTAARPEMSAFVRDVLGLRPAHVTGVEADLFDLPDGSSFAVASPQGMGATGGAWVSSSTTSSPRSASCVPPAGTWTATSRPTPASATSTSARRTDSSTSSSSAGREAAEGPAGAEPVRAALPRR